MICKTCDEEKPRSEYYARNTVIGVMPHCKECYKKMMERRRIGSREILAAKQAEYRKRNPEICAKAVEKWTSENKERMKDYQREYQQKNKKRIRLVKNRYQLDRSKVDPSYRIRKSISRRLSLAMFSAKTSKRSSVMKYLGCSIQEFKEWLESKFSKRMKWDNYGTYWQIDHIIPCSAFDHTNEDHVKICWHFTNMVPLPAVENLKKSDQITEPQMSLLI